MPLFAGIASERWPAITDNVQYQSSALATPPSTTKVATDDDGTAHHQRVKVEWGGDGVFNEVAASTPLPVAVSDGGNSVTVDGTVQVSDGGNSITIDGTVAATQSGTWTVGVSDAGNSLTVDGTVGISDGGNSITVDGTVAATQSGTWTVGVSDAGNSITVDGTVQISDGGNSITVDGTVSANQSGTWTMIISDGGNSITVDGSTASTQYTEGDVDATLTGDVILWEDTSDTVRAVSVAKPLPVQVSDGGNSITVDGTVATSSQVPGTGATNLGKAEDAAHASGDTGVAVWAVRRDAATAGVSADGDYASLNVDSLGRLWTFSIASDGGNSVTVDGTVQVSDGGNSITVDGTVQISDGGNSITVDGTVAATQSGTWTVITSDGGNSLTVDGTVQISDGGNSITVDGTVAATQSGTWTVITSDGGNSLTVDGTVITSDGGNSLTVDNAGTFATQESQLIADDATFTVASTKVFMAGMLADETGTDSVDEGDGGAARMTLDRKAIVTPEPHTAGGLSIYRNINLKEVDQEVKNGAGQVYGLWFTNTATSTRWLKFYNATTGNTQVGTTTPVITIGLPGNSSDDISGLFGGTHGIAFGTAITVAATSEQTDAGAPAVITTNDVVVNIFYA